MDVIRTNRKSNRVRLRGIQHGTRRIERRVAQPVGGKYETESTSGLRSTYPKRMVQRLLHLPGSCNLSVVAHVQLPLVFLS